MAAGFNWHSSTQLLVIINAIPVMTKTPFIRSALNPIFFGQNRRPYMRDLLYMEWSARVVAAGHSGMRMAAAYLLPFGGTMPKETLKNPKKGAAVEFGCS